MPGQRSVVGARVEPEQCLYFRAHLVRDLAALEIFFPLIRREIGQLVEETLHLGFQIVVPIRQSPRAHSEEDKQPLASLIDLFQG